MYVGEEKLKITGSMLLLFLAAFLTTIPVTAQESKKHYISPVLTLEKGEYPIGDITVWTDEQGLRSSLVLYDEDPNGFDPKWEQIRIKLQDGTSIGAKSIESHSKSNFVQVLHDTERVIYWIPFEAIESITLKNVEPKPLQAVTIVKEIYGRFSFTYKTPYGAVDLAPISLSSVNISLFYPLKSGARTISGFLFEGLGNLEYFDGIAWQTITWRSVSKIEIRFGKDKVASSAIPKFTYRIISKNYSNIWNEYSFPEDKPNKSSANK